MINYFQFPAPFFQLPQVFLQFSQNFSYSYFKFSFILPGVARRGVWRYDTILPPPPDRSKNSKVAEKIVNTPGGGIKHLKLRLLWKISHLNT